MGSKRQRSRWARRWSCGARRASTERRGTVAASARTRAWSRRTRGGAPWGHHERAAMEPRAAVPSARQWDEAATRAANGVRMRVRRPPAAPARRGDGERAARTRHRRGTDAYPGDFFLFFFSDSSPCARGLGTRRTNYLRRVPETVAHGEFIPTPSGSGHAVFLFFCAVYLDKHTAKLFAVCPKFGTRQTRPLPCL